MEKKLIREEVPFAIDWKEANSISSIKKDIEKLEELGATEIEVDYVNDFGDIYIGFTAYKYELESDQAFENRIKSIENAENIKKQQELKLYQTLRQKYEGKL